MILTGDSMTLSRAERCGNRLKLWNTNPMRLRSRFSSLPLSAPCTSWPSNRMGPDWISSSRFTVRISVDLPEPDGPQTTTTSPRATSALMSMSAGMVP